MWAGNSNASGGSGAELWKLLAGAGSDIDIDSGAGATGVFASLPIEDKLKLVLTSIFGGTNFSGALHIDGTKYNINGTVSNGGTVQTITGYVDFGTSDYSAITFENLDFNLQVTDGNRIFQYNGDKDTVTESIGDMTTGENYSRTIDRTLATETMDKPSTGDSLVKQIAANIFSVVLTNSAGTFSRIQSGATAASIGVENAAGTGATTVYGTNGAVTNFKQLGVSQIVEILGGTAWTVQNGAGVNQFIIDNTGAIKTNQVAIVAPVALPGLFTKLLPVYHPVTGLLVGNIPVI